MRGQRPANRNVLLGVWWTADASPTPTCEHVLGGVSPTEVSPPTRVTAPQSAGRGMRARVTWATFRLLLPVSSAGSVTGIEKGGARFTAGRLPALRELVNGVAGAW